MVDARSSSWMSPRQPLPRARQRYCLRVMQSPAKKGVSIVYISHRMEEIFGALRPHFRSQGTHIHRHKERFRETNMR